MPGAQQGDAFHISTKHSSRRPYRVVDSMHGESLRGKETSEVPILFDTIT